ncbi:hypothetical protein [Chitinophaga rhizosphaerae]|uniref:hypothetical protein n=1 Tax=Chitinophaga rhizosphaerae TaxID=1864947 RepID=UPI000F8070EB|nr:hypothetical protein [Chitinophaga rhizosphaerae]
METKPPQLYLAYNVQLGETSFKQRIEVDNIEQADLIREAKLSRNLGKQAQQVQYSKWRVVTGSRGRESVVKSYGEERERPLQKIRGSGHSLH